MAGTYKIIFKPEDRGVVVGEDEQNHSAMVVKLTNGSHTQEVARVGFARRNTKHPDVSFPVQLANVVGSARAAVDLLNEELASSGVLL